jgi:transposase
MDQVTAIRHAVLGLGRSRRWAAKYFNVARGTVDNYVDGTVTPGKRRTASRDAPKTMAAAAALARLVDGTEVSRKQQLTAQRAWELLKQEGVDVSYTIVKQLMAARRRAVAEVFVPLMYKPGDLAEVDFFEVDVVVDRVKTVAWLFLMRLMSSSRDFCWLYARQDQTSFLDGHVRALAHFGGTPQRIAYDNLKLAVKKHLVGSERELTARFLSATSHYAFEADFCRPYQGHDKGGVEARGKNIRLQSMVPVPSGATLDDVSMQVLTDVEKRFWSKPDADVRWAREQAALTTLPRLPFDPRKTDVATVVSSRSTVVIEGATYSVPATWARLTVTSHAGVDEVEVVGPAQQSIRRRRIPKGASDIDYAAHYLGVLATKPQAVRQVADVLVAQLGGPFPAWWQRLLDDDNPRDAARKMARILRGIVDLGREECERRVARVFDNGEALSIALMVESSTLTRPLSLVPKRFDFEVEATSISRFDDLLMAASSVVGGAA